MKKNTKTKIIEALFEVIAKTSYQDDSRKYLDKILKNKNIEVDFSKNTIEIQSNNFKVLHTITIN